VHLGGAVVDPERPDLARDPRDGEVCRHAHATAQLRGAVDDPVERLCGEGLGDRGDLGTPAAGVELGARLTEQRARGSEVDLVVGDELAMPRSERRPPNAWRSDA
jgi:hypothetical protein